MSKSGIRRLVDYFLVVTFEKQLDSNQVSDSKTNNNSSNTPEFQPIIASRYPLEDHVGTPLHESVTCFCHPQGNVKPRKAPPNLPKVHYFVMTGARGGLMYGTCLTIYEPYISPVNDSSVPESATTTGTTATTDNEAPTSTWYLPKCICLLSSFPYLIAFREYLIQLQRLISSGEMTVPIERYITNICYEVPAPPPGSLEIQTSILDSVITFWSLPHNLPIAWVSLPFSTLFECLNTDNILSIWLALVLERQVLFTSTQLSLLTLCCEILTSLLFPFKWSHAYIPVLPKFLIPILSAPMPFLCGIHKENLPEALLNVSSECIIVDLDKNNINVGPMTPDIPCLPIDYENALRYMLEKHAGRYFREARSFTKNENLFDKGIPLANDLKKIGQHVWESKLMLYDDASMLAFTNKTKSDYLNGSTGLGQDFVDSAYHDKTGEEFPLSPSSSSHGIQKQSNWDAVQETFLSFFICVLRNYREYMIYPSKAKDDEHVASYDGAGFLSKNFVKSERYDARDFLNQLLGTQMWDEFATKRLYGSSSPDVIFFDDAVNRFSKISTASLFMGRRKLSMDKYLEKSHNMRKNKSSWASLQHTRAISLKFKDNTENVDEYLLQSAKLRSRLKTMVSPEPLLPELGLKDDRSQRKHSDQTYIYKEFPSQWNISLLGNPRPLPLAALSEFDNQRENTVKFRRRKITEEDFSISPQDPTTLAEIATFTLFFVSFTSVVGHLILVPSESSNGTHLPTPIPTIGDGLLKSNVSITSPKSTLEGIDLSKQVDSDGSSGDLTKNKQNETQDDIRSDDKQLSPRFETSRIRFQHSRKYLEIEESKAKAKAALGIAFDILECMKLRNLKADPESYQCLMEACGKCGDTKRVSQLLVRMHEDGIVADSAVYSSLVTAFSSDTVLNTANLGPKETALPGRIFSHLASFFTLLLCISILFHFKKSGPTVFRLQLIGINCP